MTRRREFPASVKRLAYARSKDTAGVARCECHRFAGRMAKP